MVRQKKDQDKKDKRRNDLIINNRKYRERYKQKFQDVQGEKVVLKEENDKLRAELEILRKERKEAHHETTQTDETPIFNSCRQWQRPTALLNSLTMDDLVKLKTICHNEHDKVEKQERHIWLILHKLCEKLVENGTPQEKVNDWKLKSEESLKKAEIITDITGLQVKCRLLNEIIQYDYPRILGDLEDIGCTVSYMLEKQ